jgi:arylsulfatase
MTSKYPSFHAIGFTNGDALFGPALIGTLPEILNEIRFRTAAFVSTIVLRRGVGLESGFKHYDDSCCEPELNRPDVLKRNGLKTTEAALHWLAHNTENNLFLWMHYMDVHGPYVPPEPWGSIYADDDSGPESRLLECVPDGLLGGIPQYQVLKPIRDSSGRLIDYEKDAKHYVSQYDTCIRYVDSLVGTLTEKLQELGMWDTSMLVVASDHGEAMGENNVFFFHGLSLTLDQIRIPLIIKMPQNRYSGLRVTRPVSALDIMPTVLHAIGYDCSTAGRLSLFDYVLSNQNTRDRQIFSEMEGQISVVKGPFQLLCRRDDIGDRECGVSPLEASTELRLADYTSDPEGKHNIVQDKPDLTQEMLKMARMYMHLANASHSALRGRFKPLLEEEETRIRERLKQLGYIPRTR